MNNCDAILFQMAAYQYSNEMNTLQISKPVISFDAIDVDFNELIGGSSYLHSHPYNPEQSSRITVC